MRTLLMLATICGLMSAPAHADHRELREATQTGVFAGARVRIPLGAKTEAKPQAALTVAMSQAYRLPTGRTVTRTGEGVALDFASGRPVVMLAGTPAAVAFGLRQEGSVNSDKKLGLSTGVWVGIGVVVVAAGVLAVTQLTCIGKDKDFCGSD